ncbi:MAG: hypothetical protein J0I90_00280, partial [Nitrosospira sp.]|nr:hypothetical protein [Nitrosospira sp.]
VYVHDMRLPGMLHEFRERHAGYTVEIREMNSATQLAAIFESKIDIGFVHHPATGYFPGHSCRAGHQQLSPAADSPQG